MRDWGCLPSNWYISGRECNRVLLIKFSGILALLVAVTLSLTACSGGGSSDSPSNGDAPKVDYSELRISYMSVTTAGEDVVLENGNAKLTGYTLAEGVTSPLINTGTRGLVTYTKKTNIVLEVVEVPERALDFDTRRQIGVEPVQGLILDVTDTSVTIQGAVQDRELSTSGNPVFQSPLLRGYLIWAKDNEVKVTLTYDTEPQTALAFIS